MIDLSKLKPRQQMIAAALAAAVFFSFYMRFVQAPVSKSVKGYNTRAFRAKNQLSDLKAKFPLASGSQEKIKALEDDSKKLLEQIHQLDKKLPPRKDTSQLIGEFTRLAKEAKLLEIRQRTETKDGFSRVYIELKLDSNYLNAIRYLSQIETISPFIRIEEIDINESKGKSVNEGGTPVRALISSLLGDSPLQEKLRAADEAPMDKEVRDILVSKAKPVLEIDDKEFSLNGITFNSDTPTAIINGDVMKVDSTVKGLKVKKITADGVILTDGVQDHLLSMKR